MNSWLSELNRFEQDFQQQAEAIKTWDSLIVNNALKILKINEKVEELKVQNTKLARALDFIVEQQNEIEKLLEPLERNKVETNSNGERETTYNMVATVQNELQSFSEDLQNFIVKLNDVRLNETSSDPIYQIEQVLNAQMDALLHVERYLGGVSKSVMSQ